MGDVCERGNNGDKDGDYDYTAAITVAMSLV